MRVVAVVATLLLCACPRAVRTEKREQAFETGISVSFGADGDRRWDFGDGSASVRGERVEHRFDRAGHYIVRAYDDKTVTDQIDLDVFARSVTHMVPPAAVNALLLRHVREVAPIVDLAERIGGSQRLEEMLDRFPLLAFMIEQSLVADGAVDRDEGSGVFSLKRPDRPDVEQVVPFVGVTSEAQALTAFEGFAQKLGWSRTLNVYSRGDEAFALLADRGALFEVHGPTAALLQVIRDAPTEGLGSAEGFEAQLQTVGHGGLLLYFPMPKRVPTMASGTVERVLASVHVEAKQVFVEGRIAATGPLWEMHETMSTSLLTAAPVNAVAAMSLPVSLGQVMRALAGKGANEKTPLDDLLAALRPPVEVAAYLDIDEVLKNVVNGERAIPRGTLLSFAGVKGLQTPGRVLEIFPRATRSSALLDSTAGGVPRWSMTIWGQPAMLAVSDEQISLRIGEEMENAQTEDVRTRVREQFPHAFDPGHATAWVDIAGLKAQALTPRSIEGLDPRKVLLAQTALGLVADYLPPIEAVLIDVAPDAKGATFVVQLQLSAPAPRARPQ